MKDAATVQDYQELASFLVGRFDAIDKKLELMDRRLSAVEENIITLPTRAYVDVKFAETHNLIIKKSLRMDALVDVLHSKQVINDSDKKLVNRYKNI